MRAEVTKGINPASLKALLTTWREFRVTTDTAQPRSRSCASIAYNISTRARPPKLRSRAWLKSSKTPTCLVVKVWSKSKTATPVQPAMLGASVTRGGRGSTCSGTAAGVAAAHTAASLSLGGSGRLAGTFSTEEPGGGAGKARATQLFATASRRLVSQRRSKRLRPAAEASRSRVKRNSASSNGPSRGPPPQPRMAATSCIVPRILHTSASTSGAAHDPG
mmetsp:Transcript_95913/g.213411  ORF Transcript_95913/g.213411 Transcript_95913/m.213411 type:complete len:220 (-) Transcript_95913:8-667(-)